MTSSSDYDPATSAVEVAAASESLPVAEAPTVPKMSEEVAETIEATAEETAEEVAETAEEVAETAEEVAETTEEVAETTEETTETTEPAAEETTEETAQTTEETTEETTEAAPLAHSADDIEEDEEATEPATDAIEAAAGEIAAAVVKAAVEAAVEEATAAESTTTSIATADIGHDAVEEAATETGSFEKGTSRPATALINQFLVAFAEKLNKHLTPVMPEEPVAGGDAGAAVEKKPTASDEEPISTSPSEVVVEAKDADETTAESAAAVEPAATEAPAPLASSLWGVDMSTLTEARETPATAAQLTSAQRLLVIKYLRARQGDASAAADALLATLVWRHAFGVESLMASPTAEDIAVAAADGVLNPHVGRIAGIDREGHPVCWSHYGSRLDTGKLLETPGFEGLFLRWRISLIERAMLMLDFQGDWSLVGADTCPHGLGTHDTLMLTQVHDYEGVGLFSSMGRDARIKALTKEVISLMSDHYPETLRRKFFINVPRLMAGLMSVFSAFTPAATKSKFIVASAGSAQSALFEHIDPTNVPVEYGGFFDDSEQALSRSSFDLTAPARQVAQTSVSVPAGARIRVSYHVLSGSDIGLKVALLPAVAEKEEDTTSSGGESDSASEPTAAPTEVGREFVVPAAAPGEAASRNITVTLDNRSAMFLGCRYFACVSVFEAPAVEEATAEVVAEEAAETTEEAVAEEVAETAEETAKTAEEVVAETAEEAAEATE
ncbi:hypothetical protein, variant [Fonticula alba]|uniref:CRAL-TRIO domain-containing protein n=1 Tax=Fonticula alba TaxID=691883 RepID=A0A058ZEC2_FONAL|nr:hypothetical protein, variant [Fonticula alba]KCV72755.1 hypothetical protein, variant [Fonticula alba]|eukprot:XP_009492456.1 hypothetical protein, variant [Fonticula alba]